MRASDEDPNDPASWPLPERDQPIPAEDDDRVSTWWFVIWFALVLVLIAYVFTRDIPRGAS